MTFRIFPSSPLPANAQRVPQWRETGTEFDTGLGQAGSALAKPLYDFNFTYVNAPQSRQQSLELFFNDGKGRSTPFYMMDPYDQTTVGSYLFANTGSGVTTAFFRNQNSYHYFPDSATFSGAFTSNLSGTLDFNTDYVLDQETGIVTFSLTIVDSDWITVSKSVDYFKKWIFKSPIRLTSPRVFGQFNIQVTLSERAR